LSATGWPCRASCCTISNAACNGSRQCPEAAESGWTSDYSGEPARLAPIQKHERERGMFFAFAAEDPRRANRRGKQIREVRTTGRAGDPEAGPAQRVEVPQKRLKKCSITRSHRACAGRIHPPGFRSSTGTAAVSLSLLGPMRGGAGMGLPLRISSVRGFSLLFFAMGVAFQRTTRLLC
jgi:hypothetical protein